jgi:hypothetical protein
MTLTRSSAGSAPRTLRKPQAKRGVKSKPDRAAHSALRSGAS